MRRTWAGRTGTGILGGIVGALLAVTVVPSVADVLTDPAPDPLPRTAFVVRNDVPADALAVGPVAGALGGITVTTPSSMLSDPARQALVDFDPDVVYVAGGTAAITAANYEAIDSAGDWRVERLAGTGRDDTARLVAAVLADLGVGRPVVTGAQVAGDAYLGGSLAVDSLDVADGVDATTLDGRAPADVAAVYASHDDDLAKETFEDGTNVLEEVTFTLDHTSVVSIDYSAVLQNERTFAESGLLYALVDWDGQDSTAFEHMAGITYHLIREDGGQANLSSTTAVELGPGTHTVQLVASLTIGYHNASSLVVTAQAGGTAPPVGITPQ